MNNYGTPGLWGQPKPVTPRGPSTPPTPAAPMWGSQNAWNGGGGWSATPNPRVQQGIADRQAQNDAIAMMSRARGLNSLDYRYGMAGLPSPYQVPALDEQQAYTSTGTPGVQTGGYTPPAPAQPAYPAQSAVQAAVRPKARW